MMETLDMLEAVGRMASLADDLLAAHVTRARAEGATWAEIAERLGRSRQAVQKRFGVRTRPGDRDPDHPGKGNPTLGALATQDVEMACRSCGEMKLGKEFPTVRRQRPGGPVREDRCRDCRDVGRP